MGITLGGAETALRNLLTDNDMSGPDFRALSEQQQRAMIDSGQFHCMARTASTAYNRISAQKQARHVEGTKRHENYGAQRTNNGKSCQSDLRITQNEAQALVYGHAGRGIADYDKCDEWRK